MIGTRTGKPMAKFRDFSSCLMLLMILIGAHARADIQFQNGTYFGSVQLEEIRPVIPMRLDAFSVQPSQGAFPHLETILKVNLGGFEGPEYTTYHFKTVAYDFSQGVMTLDDPALDVTAVLQVSSNDSFVILDGSLTYRPTLKRGHLHLEMSTDGTPISLPTASPIMPLLAGEYSGLCDGQSAALQIETGRETSLDRMSRGDLDKYTVSGRIGNRSLCVGTDQICASRFFSKGIYQLFSGQLQLSGAQGNLNCQADGGTLQCTQSVLGHIQNCNFAKPDASPIHEAASFPARYHLPVTADQSTVLPTSSPPDNAALIEALSGDYYGILHHERSDAYQLVVFKVAASNSNSFAGNPNDVNISSTLGLVLGNSWSSPAIQAQVFERRSFNWVPFFTLSSDQTDGAFVVTGWKKGFISGDWISKGFGRVGTIELIKGQTPVLPATLAILPVPGGNYIGPTSGATVRNNRNLTLSLFALESSGMRNTAQLTGESYSAVGPVVSIAYDSGAYDFYSGNLSLLRLVEPNQVLTTGSLDAHGGLSLVWPSSPVPGVIMSGYGLRPFGQNPGP